MLRKSNCVKTSRIFCPPVLLCAALAAAARRHQAVRDVAPGFAAAAHAPDGLVEAVESADGLALGVQWHAENLASGHSDHAAVFTWLVDAAAGGALLKR